MKAIIGIGLPGCGKTTILKPLAEKENLAYINADDIREELTGDPNNHTKEVAVWLILYRRIKENLLQRRGVVVDVTNTRHRDRVKMVNFCREYGADQVVGYWINASLETCIKRNEQRQKVVPLKAIQKMQRRLEENPPAADEGFDEIIETATG